MLLTLALTLALFGPQAPPAVPPAPDPAVAQTVPAVPAPPDEAAQLRLANYLLMIELIPLRAQADVAKAQAALQQFAAMLARPGYHLERDAAGQFIYAADAPKAEPAKAAEAVKPEPVKVHAKPEKK